MEDTAQIKAELRSKMRALRDGMGAAERTRIDALIAQHIFDLPEYHGAHAVFTYLSVGAEVDTREIIRHAWHDGKLVAVPRCVPGTNLMEWYRLASFEALEPGAFGIQEPAPDPALRVLPPSETSADAIALVPAYSFDVEGYRLGYGGGFYDVFLAEFGGVSVGLCRSAQMSQEPLPRYETDIAVDIVVTEG